MRNVTLQELLASPDEIEAAKTASAAPGEGSAIGSTIGTVVGGTAGALLALVPGVGPALAIPAMGAGAGLGGALGSAIGQQVGGNLAGDAEKHLEARDAFRAKTLAEMNARRQSLQDLLGQ